MLDLDDMLRTASREPQPGGPPPGGFDELQRRLHPPAQTGLNAGYLGLSVLLAVVGLTCWYLLASPRQPLNDLPATLPATVRQRSVPPVAADAGLSRITEGSPAHTVVKRPPVSPVGPPNDSDIQVAAAQASTSGARPTDSRQSQKAAATPASTSPRPVAAKTVTTRRIKELTAPPIAPLQRNAEIVPSSITVAEAIEPRSAGQWDVRLNVYPNPARRSSYLDYYTGEPPAGNSYNSTAYVVDGRLRLLYWAGTVNNITRYVQPIGQLQVARYTRGGLTYGLGATYFHQRKYPEKSVMRQLGEEAFTYVAYTDVELRMWLLAANVGYVFPTNSRWKPWVHGGLQMALRSVKREERQVLDTKNRNTWSQSSTTTLAYPAFGEETWIVPNAEVGIQYRLSTHWAAGLSVGAAPGSYADINPTLGAELHFRW